MQRRGVVGEGLVIPLVILVTLVSSAAFVFAVSATLFVKATPSWSSASSFDSSSNSFMLLDLFLSDTLNGVSVKEVLMGLPDRESREQDALALEKLFSERYGCGGTNSFVVLYLGSERTVARSDSSSTAIRFSLGYPERLYSGNGFTTASRVYDDGGVILFGSYASAHPQFASSNVGSASIAVDGKVLC
ncbi:MAG: hypothetical protein AABX53_02135 [Nanoarchaeota archaeon]